MAFVKARRRLAAWICPDMARLANVAADAAMAAVNAPMMSFEQVLRLEAASQGFFDPDEARAHSAAREGWIEGERAALTEERKKIHGEPSREDRFHAVAAVVALSETFDASGNPGIDAGQIAPDLQQNTDQDGLVNTRPGFEQCDPVLYHESLHPVVGTTDGRGHPGSGQGKTGPGCAMIRHPHPNRSKEAA